MKIIRRGLLVLSATLIAVLACTGVSPAITSKAINGKDAQVTAQGAPSARDVCNFTGYWGHAGQMICDTQRQQISVYGSPTQDVVIGSDFYVYYDNGSGWHKLQDGRASYQDSSSKLGIFKKDAYTIYVLGTDRKTYYCNKFPGGGWNGWYAC